MELRICSTAFCGTCAFEYAVVKIATNFTTEHLLNSMQHFKTCSSFKLTFASSVKNSKINKLCIYCAKGCYSFVKVCHLCDNS